MLLRFCFTILIACSVLAMPNGQVSKSKSSTSNTTTGKTVSAKLVYACYKGDYELLPESCQFDLFVDEKFVWWKFTYRENDLLNAPPECNIDGDVCIKASAPLPPAVSNRRILKVWYGDGVASCPCDYKADAPGSTTKRCQCELKMRITREPSEYDYNKYL
jgi:hypothetical protein